ncbi:hypothetical protein E4U21_004567 [Claviceps maximensis]|nr:hypothetical protein E4U21_004567 [Claviceps maximensis]
MDDEPAAGPTWFSAEASAEMSGLVSEMLLVWPWVGEMERSSPASDPTRPDTTQHHMSATRDNLSRRNSAIVYHPLQRISAVALTLLDDPTGARSPTAFVGTNLVLRVVHLSLQSSRDLEPA